MLTPTNAKQKIFVLSYKEYSQIIFYKFHFSEYQCFAILEVENSIEFSRLDGGWL